GFETGDFSKWNSVSAGAPWITIATNIVHSGRFSAKLHYEIPTTLASHQDYNNYFTKNFSSPLQGDIYVRGYVYFQSPTNGGSKDIQRKIYYLKKGAGSDCSDPRYWSTGLTTDATPGTGHLMQLRIWYFDCVNGDHSIFSDTNLDYDTWYAIEFHV